MLIWYHPQDQPRPCGRAIVSLCCCTWKPGTMYISVDVVFVWKATISIRLPEVAKRRVQFFLSIFLVIFMLYAMTCLRSPPDCVLLSTPILLHVKICLGRRKQIIYASLVEHSCLLLVLVAFLLLILVYLSLSLSLFLNLDNTVSLVLHWALVLPFLWVVVFIFVLGLVL